MTHLFQYHLGIGLIIWMLAGFIMGLKAIYIDKKLSRSFIEKYIGENEGVVSKNKWTFLAAYTLGGFIAVVGDIYSMFRKD